MATLDQLGIALKNADAAGDTVAAQKLAGAIKQIRGTPGASEAPKPLDVGDVAKSAGTGLVRGAEGLAGTPADLATSKIPSSIGQTLLNPVFHFFEKLAGQTPEQSAARDVQSAQTQKDILQGAAASLPTSQNIAATVEPAITGGQGLHEPTSTAGKYAETAGEFAAGAATGPVKGLVGRLVKFGLVPGVASEAAGEAAHKVAPSLEGPARAVAGLAAGGLGAIEKGVPASERLAAIRSDRDANYVATRNTPMVIEPDAFRKGMGQVLVDAQNAGFKDFLHTDAAQTAKVIRDQVRSGVAPTLTDVDQIRQYASDILRSPSAKEGDKRMARVMRDGIDRFLDNLKPSDVIAGSRKLPPSLASSAHWTSKLSGSTAVNAKDAIDALKAGRALHAQTKKAEAIEDVFADAERRAGASSSLPGKQSALIQEFKSFANSDKFKKAGNWTRAERDAINKISRGGPIENVLNLIASISGIGDKTSLGTLLKVITSPIKGLASIGGNVRAGAARDLVLGGEPSRVLNPGAVAGQVSGNNAPNEPSYGGPQQ